MYILSYFNKQQIFKTMLLAPLFLSAFSLSIHAMDDSSVGLEEWISEIFAKSPEEQTVDQDLILTDLLWQPLDFTDLDCADNNISTTLDNLASEIATTQRSNSANKRQKTTHTNTPAATSNINRPQQLSCPTSTHQKYLEDVSEIHPQNKSYKCNTRGCDYRRSLEKVIQHMKEAHPRKIAICQVCGAGYHKQVPLRNHTQNKHTKPSNLIWNNLNQTTQSSSNQNTTLSTPQPVVTPQVSATINPQLPHQGFIDLTNTPTATSNIKLPEQRSCPISKHQRSLEEVSEIHPQNQIYKCNTHTCNDRGSLEEIIKHMKEKHSWKKAICEVCGAGYTHQSQLLNHSQNKHPLSNHTTTPSIPKPIAPPQVPVTINSQLLTLSNIKRLTREIYNMQTPKQDLIDLTKDANPHDTQQPPVDQYQCNAPNCTYQAPLNRLLEHAKQGHPERTFICQLCGCSYNNESQVKSHMRIYHHQNDTLQEPQNPLHYQCNTLSCNYAGPLHSLIEHMKQSHTNSPFVCEFCGCSYRYNPLLASHMKTYHLS